MGNHRVAWSRCHPVGSLMLAGGTRNVTSTLGQKRNVSSLDNIVWCGKESSVAGRAVSCER